MKSKFDAIVRPRQAEYLDKLHPSSKGVFAEMEGFARANNVPIADREVALFLEITSRLIDARRALEIGTAIGYGAAHIARGMREGGKVTTIEPNPEMISNAEKFLVALGLRERVEIIHGKALDIIPSLTKGFDMLYLDALKEEYAGYLEQALPFLRIGGIVVADNLLWGGQVAAEIISADQESSTIALRKFNQQFVSHPQLRAEVLSVGDGLGYAVKIA